ncbi:DUF3466 family protein [Aliivibrio finisterrensis]|uniref:DUF3466 family protein n=1 Tax=Aliivibrio finisterrensis TaxID=511998 RepID=A0A6N6RSU3_9GAMM|nr:DUF3466 family protein [Aliivibrio finisterrensis]KAB2824696.1 DUF3466 family protein [Aliivibrio finisterrensis]
MSSKLQLTTLAVLVSAALPAQAALYKVVEVTNTGGVTGAEYYGTAIQPSGSEASCFTTDCEDGIAYALAGETRNRAAGFSYREEVPFAMDNSFGYIKDNYDGFEYYCESQLGYSTCEYWASTQWSGWNIETYGTNTPNSLAFIDGSAEKPTDSINTVINSFSKVSGASSTIAIGNYSNATSRNVPISGDTLTDSASKEWKQGRQWASDGAYTVGSVSSKTGIGGERYNYFSKAVIWKNTDGSAVEIPWAHNDQQDGDYYAQGSMRDLYVDNTTSTFYGVGYNNYKDQHMNATIFTAEIGASDTLTNIKSIQINDAQVDAGDDNTNSNSVATNINSNLVAVGQAKRSGNYPQNGAAANRLFIVPNASVTPPSANFLSDLADAKSVFFNGAGGAMGGINNFNEIVGRVDVENNREYDGKQRRQRAFIYPYNGNGTDVDRAKIFNNRAWIIDDLTNDGKVSGTTDNNNQFRIYDASDINDAGVISATALKCSGGYDSTAHDAYCGNGEKKEKVVAVKLVPIAGAVLNPDDKRGYENRTIERQGGSLGFGAMTLLGLFGFMRKRIK